MNDIIADMENTWNLDTNQAQTIANFAEAMGYDGAYVPFFLPGKTYGFWSIGQSIEIAPHDFALDDVSVHASILIFSVIKIRRSAGRPMDGPWPQLQRQASPTTAQSCMWASFVGIRDLRPQTFCTTQPRFRLQSAAYKCGPSSFHGRRQSFACIFG